jgi:hypothetical protein
MGTTPLQEGWVTPRPQYRNLQERLSWQGLVGWAAVTALIPCPIATRGAPVEGEGHRLRFFNHNNQFDLSAVAGIVSAVVELDIS